MSEITATFVVDTNEITITPSTSNIDVAVTTIPLNVYSLGYAQPGGNTTQLQYNNGGVFGGVPYLVYANGNVQVNNLTKLKIVGGANAYFLQTDGTGNLTWAPGTVNANTGNGVAVGANTQIQVTDGTGNFVSAPGFTYDSANTLFTTPGDGFFSGNVTAQNFIGNANVSNVIANNGVFNNLTVNNNINANTANFSGNIAPLGILTDNYYYANGSPLDFEQPGGVNTAIQFNDANDFGGSNAFTFDKTTNVVTATGLIQAGNTNTYISTANYFVGNGNSISNVRILEYGNSNLTFFVNGNSTSLIWSSNSSVGIVEFFENSVKLPSTNVFGNLNVTGTISFSNIAADIVTANAVNALQANITNQLNATFIDAGSIDANGYVEANIFRNGNITYDNANYQIQFVTGSNSILFYSNTGVAAFTINDTGTNTNTSTANTFVGLNANIGQVNSTYLQVGTGYSANATINGNGVFTGNGSGLTGINANGITSGTLSNLRLQGNYNINANTAGTVTNSAQPNITSVGNLTGLTVNGTLNATTLNANSITGNLSILQNGTSNISVLNNSNITMKIGNNSNLVVISASGMNLIGVCNATQVHSNYFFQPNGVNNQSVFYETFINGQLIVANSANVISLAVTQNANFAGNVTITQAASRFIGNGAGLNNIQGSAVTGQVSNAFVASTVYTAAQPNITSVGTLTGLVTGNVFPAQHNLRTIGNASNYFSDIYAGNFRGAYVGSGSQLFGIVGANVTGSVANATYANTAGTANTVTTNAQPNITSVGSLSSLTVTGNYNTTNGNIITTNGNITSTNGTITSAFSNATAYANALQFYSYAGNGTAPLIVVSQTKVSNLNVDLLDGYNTSLTAVANTIVVRDANAAIAGTLSTAAQPNITSLGTLTSLAIDNTNLVANLNAQYLNGGQASTSATANTIVQRDANASIIANVATINRISIGAGNPTSTIASPVTINANFYANSSNLILQSNNTIILNTNDAVKFESGVIYNGNIPTTTSGTFTAYLGEDNHAFITSNAATGNYTLNMTGNATTTLSSLMSIGDRTEYKFTIWNQLTPYVANVIQIDGANTTVRWLNNAAPTGTANRYLQYDFQVYRTGVLSSDWIVLGDYKNFGV